MAKHGRAALRCTACSRFGHESEACQRTTKYAACIDEICAKYKAGVGTGVLADNYGISAPTIARLIRKNGLVVRPRATRRGHAIAKKKRSTRKGPVVYFLAAHEIDRVKIGCAEDIDKRLLHLRLIVPINIELMGTLPRLGSTTPSAGRR